MLENIKSSWSRALLLAAAIVPLAGHFGFMSVQQITKSHLVNLATASVQWWGLLFLVWAAGILLLTLVGEAHHYLPNWAFKSVKRRSGDVERVERLANLIRAKQKSERSGSSEQADWPEQEQFETNYIAHPSNADRKNFGVSDLVKLGLILGIAIVIAAFLIRDRYIVMSGSGGTVYVVNRFTGETRFCTPRECFRIDQKQTNNTAAASPSD